MTCYTAEEIPAQWFNRFGHLLLLSSIASAWQWVRVFSMWGNLFWWPAYVSRLRHVLHVRHCITLKSVLKIFYITCCHWLFLYCPILVYCLFFLWNTDTCRSHSGLCLMKYLQAMCSCLLGANLSGAIYPPEQAAEEMQAETADAGLEMWRYGKCEEYCTPGKTRFDMRVNQVVLYCSRHKYRKQISNIFLTLKQSSCSMK